MTKVILTLLIALSTISAWAVPALKAPATQTETMADECPPINFSARSPDPKNPNSKTNLTVVESIKWNPGTHTYTITGPVLGDWLGYPGVSKAPNENDPNYDPNKLVFKIQVGGTYAHPLVFKANVQQLDLDPPASEYATCQDGVLTFYQDRSSNAASWISGPASKVVKLSIGTGYDGKAGKIVDTLDLDFVNLTNGADNSIELYPGPKSNLVHAYTQ